MINVFGQEKTVWTLEPFSKVNLSGNIEVNLIASTQPSIEIEINRNVDLSEYKTEVQNGELFFYRKKEFQNQDEPKVVITLGHTGIHEFDLSGIVKLYSEDVLKQSELTINGSGMISGEIQVAARDLQVSLSGISNLTISGKADNAELNIDGMGKISARDLAVSTMQKNADGFAKVKLARN